MKNPLQHSNSRVAGEELSDPMARGSRNELWTAARVLELRGSARGGEVRNSEGRGGGLDARRGEGEGRGMGEVGDSTRGEGRGGARQGRGGARQVRGGARQGRGGSRQGRGREQEMYFTWVFAAGWCEVGARLLLDCEVVVLRVERVVGAAARFLRDCEVVTVRVECEVGAAAR
jgi:hypothetical protein